MTNDKSPPTTAVAEIAPPRDDGKITQRATIAVIAAYEIEATAQEGIDRAVTLILSDGDDESCGVMVRGTEYAWRLLHRKRVDTALLASAEEAARLRGDAQYHAKELSVAARCIDALRAEVARFTAEADLRTGPQTGHAWCACEVAEVEPCRGSCSCRNPIMSGGCGRCATYGSEEQRVGAARKIAERGAEVARLTSTLREIQDVTPPMPHAPEGSQGGPQTLVECIRHVCAEVARLEAACARKDDVLSRLGSYLCEAYDNPMHMETVNKEVGKR